MRCSNALLSQYLKTVCTWSLVWTTASQQSSQTVNLRRNEDEDETTLEGRQVFCTWRAVGYTLRLKKEILTHFWNYVSFTSASDVAVHMEMDFPIKIRADLSSLTDMTYKNSYQSE